MKGCEQQASGVVELYFYDELDQTARASVERHVAGCAECRHTLDDLSTIRTALSSRPRVDAPADGDWTAFMSRLEAVVEREAEGPGARTFGRSDARDSGGSNVVAFYRADSPTSRVPELPNVRTSERPNSRGLNYASYFATAALLTLVTSGLVYVGRQAERPVQQPSPKLVASAPAATPVSGPTPAVEAAGFAAMSEQHFERSKLVVLGLASKDPKDVKEEDWAYERGLASNLLDDTRLYRLAAEERGLTTLAGVMGDLELVLLQTSLTDSPDAATLDRIQRLIAKRDLVTKMDVAVTGS